MHFSTGAVFSLLTLAALSTPAAAFSDGDGTLPVDTTLEDFFLPGTPPDPSGAVLQPILSATNCILCHADFDQAEPPLPLSGEPFRNWVGSMMGQAARDPVFWAAVSVANQDANFGGDLCIRCHSPAGWLGGRSEPTDGLGLLHDTSDFEGVTCHFCHRLVNPDYTPGESPAEDELITGDLDVLGLLPTQHGSGQYVIDELDRRRGPFNLGKNFFFHEWIQSPFHQQAKLCATCHDVSNPIYMLQPDGSYLMTPSNMAHPTGDKYDMFPIERTYSEWLNSDFGAGGVQMDGRFGGNHPTGVMASCQDCHMPDQQSPGCRVPGFEVGHPDMAAHFLNGGNTWVLKAVDTLYTDFDPIDDPPNSYNDPIFQDGYTGLTPEIIADAIDRATQMLRDASDMELIQNGNRLSVRVINMCGHKLPSGYPEGRRIWINVKFLDVAQQVVYEHGAYDFVTAELTTNDTKVYEAILGIDAVVAAKTGLPAGESMHFILNNQILFDNRIPPSGYSYAAYEAVQAEPVGYSYADGQNWDDTAFLIPAGAVEAVVTVYFQLTSKEYIEFLRDENTTDSRGQIAYDQWVLHGMSAPVDMDTGTLGLQPILPGDLDNDGIVGINDFLLLLGSWGPCPAPCPPVCVGDINGDCDIGISDFLELLANWTP
jgi:hypothetical protein